MTFNSVPKRGSSLLAKASDKTPGKDPLNLNDAPAIMDMIITPSQYKAGMGAELTAKKSLTMQCGFVVFVRVLSGVGVLVVD